MQETGRILRADITSCVVGTWVEKINESYFGALVTIKVSDTYSIVGIIHNIAVADDGLVRQLLSSDAISPMVLADNRHNRNVPVEISVLFVGYLRDDSIYHLLPPSPPLSLDEMHVCSDKEKKAFTSAHRFGYFRHLLRNIDLPTGELLAAHFLDVHTVNSEEWLVEAIQELIVLLRDDYPRLMTLMSALGDANLLPEEKHA
jgi:hypothetical protein